MLFFEQLMSVNSFTRRSAGLVAALPLLLASGSARALQPLDDFIAASRAGNFDRREAQASAEQRAAEADQARSRLAPSLTARAGYTRNERETTIVQGATTITITPLNQLEATFTLNVPLVDVGAWLRVSAASATADAARLRAQGSLDDAEKSVTRAYYQVVASEATKVAAALALATAEESRAITQRRVEAGSASDLDMERARADLSVSALARAEQLFKGGAMTQEELDRARLTADADKETSRAAAARSRAAQVGSRSEDIAAGRAALASAEARLAQAKATLDRRQIRAPYAGEVLQVKARAGEYYTPGASEAPVILGDTSHLRARMDVDERDIARLAPGQSAYVIVDAYPGLKFPGKVAEIGRRMGRKNVRTDDPTERLDTKILEVVIDLDDTTKLVPGLRLTSFINAGKGK